jgi:anti-sigma B factor antagonist
MTVDLFGVTSYEFEGGRVFALRGELDACTCRGLAELLIGPPGSLVVIDLDELTYMDSSGLGAIHAARRVAIKDGGTLIVCRPSPMVHRVLESRGSTLGSRIGIRFGRVVPPWDLRHRKRRDRQRSWLGLDWELLRPGNFERSTTPVPVNRRTAGLT